MGCAMITIMLGHQPFFYESHFVGFFHIYGSWGVDLFLFVSGFGIVHSLKKNSIKHFYKNRAIRLLPACLIVGCLKYILTLCGFVEFASSNLILLLTNVYLWYIYAIIVYYILSPWLYSALERYGVIVLVSVCVLSFLCSFVPFYKSPYYLINHIGWLTARLPIFVLGMYVVLHPLRIKLQYIIGGGVIIFVIAAILKLTTIMVRFKWNVPYLNLLVMLSTPMLCIVAGKISHIASYIKLDSAISFFGKYSLELYLWHEFIYWNLLKNDLTSTLDLRLMATIAVVSSITLAIVTKNCVDAMLRRVKLR